jgi:hypothetical protein
MGIRLNLPACHSCLDGASMHPPRLTRKDFDILVHGRESVYSREQMPFNGDACLFE